MKKYIDNIEVQKFDELNEEIIKWKKSVLKNIDVKGIIWLKWVARLFFTFGLGTFFTLLSICIIGFITSNLEQQVIFGTEYKFFIISFCSVGIGFVFQFVYTSKRSTIVKNALFTSDINPFTNWIGHLNENLVVDDNSNLYLKTTKVNDYLKMKYKLTGQKSIGLEREYELSQGVIFDNPYELSCGVWHSTITFEERTTHYYDYLPLLKMKTNLFLEDEIHITNSRDFYGFTKKDIQLEDDEFNKIFSVNSTNENAVRMLLTPIVQNKWKEISKLPPFNMQLKNGVINILFQASYFMDSERISKFSLKTFKRIENIIWKDLNIFLSILNLIFSISLIQFEEVVKNDDLNLNEAL